jgi:hypothetical protein
MSELDLFKEASVMISRATAIKREIRELIDLQIQVFRQLAPLTPFELEDFRRRAERINLLGQELDRAGWTAILHEHRRS